MASTGEAWRLGRRPALDGLRGIAILLVSVSHAWTEKWAIFGTTGVTIFFTLSGFLITSLLLEEAALSGRITLAGFYQRRMRRLAPALLAFLVVMLAAATMLREDFVDIGGAVAALMYATNWVMAGGGDTGLFSHTWSLSVEEQFYLAWPLVVVAVRRLPQWRLILLAACALGTVYAITARLALWEHGAGSMRVYMGSDTRADSILIGCALALCMHRSRVGPAHSRMALGLTVAGLSAIAMLHGSVGFAYLALPGAVASATAGVIWMTVRGSFYSGVFTNRILVAVGRRSYSWYLWNGVALHLGLKHLDMLPGPVATVLLMAVSYGIACLSWRYVEQRFVKPRPQGSVGVQNLRLRNRAAAA